jgi:hypothetical protein
MLGGAAAGIALATAGFAAFELREQRVGAAVAEAAGEPDDIPNGPVTSNGEHRRAIFKDDGEIVLNAVVPDPMVAGRDIRPHLEITNKLGQPVIADEVVVTITDTGGATKGLVATPHNRANGHYGFHYTFPAPGHYVLRVFPPSVDSSFDIPVEVVR